MKLYELISFDPVQTKRSTSDFMNKFRDRPEFKDIGVGSFGRAMQVDRPKRLNQITKIGVAGKIGRKGIDKVDDPSKDGYLSYLKMVHKIEQDGGYNPYFPRIESLRIKKSKNGEIHYHTDLEKLYPYKTSKIIQNQELMSSLKDEMFHITKHNEDYDLSMLVMVACDGERSWIKDPELAKAVSLIDKVAAKGHFRWDMGTNNMMWRITGNRPQIVITDPLV